MLKIASVVVTYNRLAVFKECINSIKNQTIRCDEIIVVNNSSTDGTLEWLSEQNDLTVITQENSGSAGGQYTGIKTAFEKGHDLVWCLDCDVIADHKALEKLVEYYHKADKDFGFASSTIYYRDGNLAHPNIPELDDPYSVLNSFVKKQPIPILSASFGSILFPSEVIKRVGLPSKDFFIWGDDAEFTLRIIRSGYKGFMVLQSIAEHKNESNEKYPYQNVDINSTKFQYGVRNMVHISIMRNQIVSGSTIRGILSVIGFTLRVYRLRERKGSLHRLNLVITLTILLFKGISFRPTIDYPKR